MSNIKTYQNGNYMVSIDLDNGTKTRENDLTFSRLIFQSVVIIKLLIIAHKVVVFVMRTALQMASMVIFLVNRVLRYLKAFMSIQSLQSEVETHFLIPT